MKRLTKVDLLTLASQVPVLDEKEQRQILGGTDDSNGIPTPTTTTTGVIIPEPYSPSSPDTPPGTTAATPIATGSIDSSTLTGDLYSTVMDLFNSSSGSVEYNITMPEITCTPKGNYPSSYESLGNYLADLANDEIGVEEGINNDRIKEYFKEAGINAGPETAWCAAFVNYIYKQTNANTPEGYGQVRVNDWKNMGKATTTPQVGDLVFSMEQTTWV